MTTSTSAPRSKAIKRYLQRFPALVSIKQFIWNAVVLRIYDSSKGTTKLDLVTTFPAYSPYSSGGYKDKANLTVQTIKRMPQSLSSFATFLKGMQLEILPIRSFASSAEEVSSALELKALLDRHGSDKANVHEYHYVYGPILKDRLGIKAVLEIGMGTDNTDVVSNMGSRGKPGASLRAFRDFLPNAKIYGADIDDRILFTDDRIDTFFVDQTDTAALESLGTSIPGKVDLVIDDGLHSPDANISTLQFAMGKVRPGGWAVVEDISPDAAPVWEIVSALLAGRIRNHLFRDGASLVFAVQMPA